MATKAKEKFEVGQLVRPIPESPHNATFRVLEIHGGWLRCIGALNPNGTKCENDAFNYRHAPKFRKGSMRVLGWAPGYGPAHAPKVKVAIEWVPVTRELPDDEITVLLAADDGEIYLGYHDSDETNATAAVRGGWLFETISEPNCGVKITHWAQPVGPDIGDNARG